ncbi:molecular chaperone DnaJ [Croceicoccus ponticola]|uniref:Molecular chaperone DnaJ n=1 Tax=Croceicoccus ponticola TaxID=2217664 RepID=A0A437GVV5_9SPHN|nr:DnaJ domain-containing protein [Croceicoccus ponticola]RVQ66023.1 molecular chaperone DnaJ [Croceicoccus ponticola]
MEHGQEFVDYYEVLKVNPDCDARILELAYHYFAKMFHPDNLATADSDRFGEVIEAYRALKDPEKRAAYDRIYARTNGRQAYQFPGDTDLAVDEKTTVDDAETHDKILLALYKRRREHASDAGVIGWFLQEMLGCSEEHFAFHTWYLKSKGFIEVTEQGTIAVTVQGVDHVISTSRTSLSETLLIQQSKSSDD